MSEMPERHKDAADLTVKDIQRKARKRYAAEVKEPSTPSALSLSMGQVGAFTPDGDVSLVIT